MKKYTKSKQDKAIEDNDLEHNPVMRWLKHKDEYDFKVGDILVKETQNWNTDKWEVCTHSPSNAPKKFMCVFKNKFGIPYLKQFKIDGSDFTSNLFSLASIEHGYTRYKLDPDYADHLMLSDDDEEFKPNISYEEKKKFRANAIKANKKILLKPEEISSTFKKFKVGDTFWAGWSWDDFATSQYEVTGFNKLHWNGEKVIEVKVIKDKNKDAIGAPNSFSESTLRSMKISLQNPHPLSQDE